MRSNFGSEKVPLPLTAGRPRIILLAAVLLVLYPAGRPAMSAVTLTQMARVLASGDAAKGKVPDVFRGYSRLGLRREAAAYLEKAIQLAAIPREQAIPLFEEIVREQSRWDDPAGLAAICETAIRNGAGTPLVIYSFGTALRQSGRLAEASSIFSRIKQDSLYYPHALYAVGQIEAEKGHGESAVRVFDRVREIHRGRGGGDALANRVALSQAELLLTLGRPGEAATLLVSLPGEGVDPITAIARAAAENIGRSGELRVSPETISRWPVRRQILLDMLQGEMSRESGQFTDAVDYFNRAEEKIQSSLGSATAPVTETVDPYEPVDLLRRQAENHRYLRSLIPTFTVAVPEMAGEQLVELLVDLLFIDVSIARAQQALPGSPGGPEVVFLSRPKVEEIIRTIEQVTLEGVEVDRLVDALARKLDIFQNLAHPIDRYRLLTSLEKSHAEIRAIRRRIHEHRESAVAGIKDKEGPGVPPSRFLQDVGRFLVELDALREASREVREFTDRHFDILRQKEQKTGRPQKAFEEMVRQALAIDGEGFQSLLPSVLVLEERARIVSWERKKLEIAALRPVVSRQIVDGLVQQARFLRTKKTTEGQQQAQASLERAVSYVRGDSLSFRDRVESAIQIGSFLEEGTDRWEPFPGRTAGKKEKEVVTLIQPILDGEGASGELREEAAYLVVSLKILTGDPGARPAAERFLREFSSSPFAGRIAVRMGHEALLAGRMSDARAMYRKAAASPEFSTAASGRYMLGWFRFQTGDAAGAAGEIFPDISDPAFRCDEPSLFEKAVLDLSVRAWGDSPLEGLDSYPPVREGTCGGRLLLMALGKSEERKGEAGRSAMVYGVLAERFAHDDEALAYERKTVDSLLRAGKEDQAFARILRLEGKYGPGTEWATARPPQVREQAREEMVAMLKLISERKFEEGVRTGESEAMAAAKTGMERFFSAKEEKRTGGDAELRLKLAIASLKAGDRDTGVAILKELAERGESTVGERAAILYAETRIAAYERKEDTAEGAEESAHLLLARYPSEKAAGLAYRAAAAFLLNGNYEGAKRMAEGIEKNKEIAKPVLYDSRLVYAEAAISTKEFAAAREKAESVFGSASKDVKPEVRERARTLFVLASLKEIESRTDGQDWTGAGRMLEDLGRRFPEDPEVPDYFLRAFRSYRMGWDMEAAVAVGMRFLDDFPARKEGVEIAGAMGAYLVERGEPGKAADLYARVAERFPKRPEAPDLLFLAARLSGENGDPEMAEKRFSSYRARYPNPRWRSAYATISIGLLAWERGDAKTGVRELEEGIRRMDAGVEKDAPRELYEIEGRGILVLGGYWGEQFRKMKLVDPLEKSLAIKDRFFRRALSLFEKAKQESPTELAIRASQMSGDLFVDFGKSILDAQRPKGLKGEESERFEKALSERARGFFEKAMDWYVGALDRLEAEGGPAYLAVPIRERIENAQVLLASTNVERGVR